ncbi:chloride peroxidase [Rhodococcus rhodnii LMG 5362]|uniref:Chloride peroxidase n=1 Tax=Rhodococcus rhodnii LMG 5362 TaxID=1273125 RepID=R7WPJ1_9NOCA|nr:chloride peroxidase [Rhodococcus rhodnii LMG 5362]
MTGDGPRTLVLLHGWAQSSRCWGDDVIAGLARDARVIAVDLRGHGYSGAPESGYDDSQVWADDVQAILDAEDAADVVLLGWSYGGLVICDHLRHHGSGRVAGVVLVGAITAIGRGEAGGRIGPAMRAAIPGAMSPRPGEAVRALGAFGTALTGPIEDDAAGARSQALFGASLQTPPRVRSALFDRTVSNDDLLLSLPTPTLLLHGESDTVVDIAAARHAESLLPAVTTSYWEGVDHAPFVEQPDRFVDVVRGFAAGLGAADRAGSAPPPAAGDTVAG